MFSKYQVTMTNSSNLTAIFVIIPLITSTLKLVDHRDMKLAMHLLPMQVDSKYQITMANIFNLVAMFVFC